MNIKEFARGENVRNDLFMGWGHGSLRRIKFGPYASVLSYTI